MPKIRPDDEYRIVLERYKINDEEGYGWTITIQYPEGITDGTNSIINSVTKKMNEGAISGAALTALDNFASVILAERDNLYPL